ncbi:MAG: DsrE family protein [Oscillospiraceae bacterium]|nr:DsrE family protein [Oscillospiraceae bacterium]
MNKEELYILWTNADPLTAHNMVMMYATNALLKRWWDEVTVIIWGATAKYVAEDESIQGKIKIAQQAGVKFTACQACAVNLGVKDTLEALGIEVISWGPPLTELIKEHKNLITI